MKAIAKIKQWLKRSTDVDDDRLWGRVGYAKTTAGQNVSEARAMGLAAYYACIRVLAEDTAKLPLVLYRRIGLTKERMTGHPLYRLLHDSPNPDMSSMAFRETLIQHAAGWGNGYAEIERAGSGMPLALHVLEPYRVTPKRDDNDALFYEVRNFTDGTIKRLRPDQVFHVHGLGYNGVCGYSPARLHAESLGNAMASREFAGKFFGNGAIAGGVLEHPGQLSPQAHKNLRDSVQSQIAGENQLSLLITEEGMKYNKLSIPPEEAQFIETQQFSVEEICRICRVPPHKIAHLLRAVGWSTLEATNTDYVIDSLMPWMVRMEQEILRKLVMPSERDLYAEHLVDGLLRGDTKSRYDSYAVARQWGWLSVNDIRGFENMPPVEGGDVYLIPANMMDASKASAPTPAELPAPEVEPEPPAPDAPEPEEDDEERAQAIREAFAPLFTAAIGRLARKEEAKAQHERGRRNAEDFGRVMTEWLSEFRHEVRTTLGPIADGFTRSLAAATGLPWGDDAALEIGRATALIVRTLLAPVCDSLPDYEPRSQAAIDAAATAAMDLLQAAMAAESTS